MEKENALIIFQKNFIPGKVKTRIANTMGDEYAMEVYRFLVQHTHKVINRFAVPKFLFYSEVVEENNHPGEYYFLIQDGNDLGEKMLNAFKTIFDKGYKNVVIIGTDCAELTPAIVESAFEELKYKSFVMGPAEDGGYYLLGMKRLQQDIFKNKDWSTSTVFKDTLKNMIDAKETYHLLPVLNDVDTEADVKKIDLSKPLYR